MDPITGMAIGQGINALAGIYGSTQAANAQKDAARQQADTARRNMLANLMLTEPARGVGYQALTDMAGLYGYSMPGYESLNSLQSSLTPIGAKGVVKGLKRGMTVDQIAQLGTLGRLNSKSLKRLTRAGLTADDIARLQGQGQAWTPPANGSDGSTGNTQQSLMDRIANMPGYQFGMQEGTKALTQSAAGRGGLFSGDSGKSLFSWGRDYSASKFGEDWDRLAQLAGYGERSTANAGNTITGTSNALMDSQQQMGDARASGVLGVTNSIGNAVNSGMNNYLMWSLMNQQPQTVGGGRTRGY